VKVTESNIRRILKKWRPRLGLGAQWTIEVRLYTDSNWPKKYTGSVACIDVQPGYSQATLRCNTDALERDGNTLEYNILHELNHVHLWRLRQIAIDALGESQKWLAEDLTEEATETATRALLAKS